MPDNVETRANRGLCTCAGKGTPGRCTRRLMQFSPKDRVPSPAPRTSGSLRSGERDPAAAERALVALGDNQCWNEGDHSEPQLWRRLLARMTKDEARARTAFEAARARQEKLVQAQPDYGRRSACSA